MFKGQGRIRRWFGPQNIFDHFIGDSMQKNVAILLVINLSKIVRIGSHFEGENCKKSLDLYCAHTCLVLAQNVQLFGNASSSIYVG